MTWQNFSKNEKEPGIVNLNIVLKFEINRIGIFELVYDMHFRRTERVERLLAAMLVKNLIIGYKVDDKHYYDI